MSKEDFETIKTKDGMVDIKYYHDLAQQKHQEHEKFLAICERRNLSTSTKSSKKRTRKFLTSLTARNVPTAAKIWGRCSPRLILKESPRLSECTSVILKMNTFASTRTATKFSNACRVRFSAQTTFARFTRFVPRHVASFRTRIAKRSIRSTI